MSSLLGREKKKAQSPGVSGRELAELWGRAYMTRHDTTVYDERERYLDSRSSFQTTLKQVQTKTKQ